MCIISSLVVFTLTAACSARRRGEIIMRLHEFLFKKPHLVAILSGTVFLFTCIASYVLSIALGHIQPYIITYISDSITDPPLSGFFGFFLNLSLILFAITACIRHLLVREVIALHPEMATPRMFLANSVSGWLIVIGTIAMTLVSHFQVHTSMFLHATGAFIGIGCGAIYFCFQAVCTTAMVPRYTSASILNLRIVLACVSVILYILGVSAGFLSLSQYDGNELHRWTLKDGGYFAHAFSSLCEWGLGLAYALYFISFASEFKYVQLQPLKVTIFALPSRITSLKENGVIVI